MVAPEGEHANRLAVTQQGHGDNGAVALHGLAGVGILRVLLDVQDMNGAPFKRCAAGRGTATRRYWMLLHKVDERRADRRSGGEMHDTVLAPENHAGLRAAQAPRALHQGSEHRLQVEGRARNHLQHFGGGRLVLQRLLRVVEQAHVDEGNHGLLGEGLEQVDLFDCKATLARHHDDAQRSAVAHHRNYQQGLVAGENGQFARSGRYRRVVLDTLHVYHAVLAHRDRAQVVRVDRHREQLLRPRQSLFRPTVGGYQVQLPAFDL